MAEKDNKAGSLKPTMPNLNESSKPPMSQDGKQQAETPSIRSDGEYRRDVAMAILSGWVARYGGFNAAERRANMACVWEMVDEFLALEHEPTQRTTAAAAPAPSHGRAARPDDEWGVRDSTGRLRRGFVTQQEAELFAAKHPGAEVRQLSGTGAMTAPSFA